MTNTNSNVIEIFDNNELYDMTSSNPLVVAIRWDLLPWCLVLDLEFPVSEEYKADVRRRWLVFENVSDFSLPFENVCMPIGFRIFGITESVDAENTSCRCYDFNATATDPTSTYGDLKVKTIMISIHATSLRGFQSNRTAPSNMDNGILTPLFRQLASDMDFIDAYKKTIKKTI